MTAAILTTIFFLHTFYTSCDLIEPKTTLVNECPKNKNETIQASKKLKCGVDEFDNNQYLCLPHVNKTSLVEFCFNGSLGIQLKGNCLETDGVRIILHGCSNFSRGCPDKYFYDYEFYKYPACLNISTEFHCYLLDPFCSTQSTTEETTNEVKETTTHEVEKTTHEKNDDVSNNFLGFSIVVVFILVGICIIGIIVVKRKYWVTKEPQQAENLSEEMMSSHVEPQQAENLSEEMMSLHVEPHQAENLSEEMMPLHVEPHQAENLSEEMMPLHVDPQQAEVVFSEDMMSLHVGSQQPGNLSFAMMPMSFETQELENQANDTSLLSMETQQLENQRNEPSLFRMETQQLENPGNEPSLFRMGPLKQKYSSDGMMPWHIETQQLENPSNEPSLFRMETQQLENPSNEPSLFRMGPLKQKYSSDGMMPWPIETQQLENPGNEPSLFRMDIEETQRSIDVEDLFSFDTENDKEIRIVLLGKTGAGKSASGNTILGDNVFVSKVSASSITSRCAYNSSHRFGQKIVIVDTPGIFDTSLQNQHTQKEIRKCIAITSPGPHAFILVLSIQRFTDEEHYTVEHFVKHFGESVYNYVIVLFTRKDNLEENSLQDFIETSPKNLRTLIRKCGGRVIAFNNKLTGAESDEQVKELLNLILRNIEENGGLFYTHKLYEAAEKLLKRKEKAMIKLTENEREMELKSTEKFDHVHNILAEEIENLIQDKNNGTINPTEFQERKQEAIKRHHSQILKLREEECRKIQEKFENKYKSTRDDVRSNIEQDTSFLDS